MSKTLEANLWSSMRRNLAPWVAAGRLQMNRLENRACSSMPDVEGHLRDLGHGQFWIELKTTHRPVRSTTPIRCKWQPGQTDWLEKRWCIGGNAYALIQVGKAHSRRLYLVPGKHTPKVEAGLFNEGVLQEVSCVDPTSDFEAIVREASCYVR